MSQQHTNLYREMLERWHRCKAQWPALDHDALFPKQEDYHLDDRTAEAIRLEVEKEFKRE